MLCLALLFGIALAATPPTIEQRIADYSGTVPLSQTGLIIADQLSALKPARLSEEFAFFLSERVLQVIRDLEAVGLVCPNFKLAFDEQPLISVLLGECHLSDRHHHPVDYLLATNVFSYSQSMALWYGESGQGESFIKETSIQHMFIFSREGNLFLELLYDIQQQNSALYRKASPFTSQNLLDHPFFGYWNEQLERHSFLGSLIESNLLMVYAGQDPFEFTARKDFQKLMKEALKSNYTYEPLFLIQSGAFGEVWEANQLDQNKQIVGRVAIKTALKHDSLEVSLAEAKIMSKLKGNHLVEFHQIIPSSADSLDIVMELMTGLDLFDFLEYADKHVALLLTHDLAAGLMEMHRLGYVHRDIKPENAFVLANGTLKIFDLGTAFHLAKESEKRTEGTGTVQYLSPDIFASGSSEAFSEGVGKPHDVWALGVTAFDILCRYTMWEEAEWIELMTDPAKRESLEVTHDWLKARCSKGRWDSNGQLERVILGCLNMNKHSRLTAQQVKEQLEMGVDLHPLRDRLKDRMQEALTKQLQKLQTQESDLEAKLADIRSDLEDLWNDRDQAQAKALDTSNIDNTIAKFEMNYNRLYGSWIKQTNIQNLLQSLKDNKELNYMDKIKAEMMKEDEEAIKLEIKRLEEEEEAWDTELATIQMAELTLQDKIKQLEKDAQNSKPVDRHSHLLLDIEKIDEELRKTIQQELQIDRKLEYLRSKAKASHGQEPSQEHKAAPLDMTSKEIHVQDFEVHRVSNLVTGNRSVTLFTDETRPKSRIPPRERERERGVLVRMVKPGRRGTKRKADGAVEGNKFPKLRGPFPKSKSRLTLSRGDAPEKPSSIATNTRRRYVVAKRTIVPQAEMKNQ